MLLIGLRNTCYPVLAVTIHLGSLCSFCVLLLVCLVGVVVGLLELRYHRFMTQMMLAYGVIGLFCFLVLPLFVIRGLIPLHVSRLYLFSLCKGVTSEGLPGPSIVILGPLNPKLAPYFCVFPFAAAARLVQMLVLLDVFQGFHGFVSSLTRC